VQRYQWEQPGDMIHVDIQQLARFERVGHRITGDLRKGSSPADFVYSKITAGGVGLRDALRQLGGHERSVVGLPADL
jgi:hypothetical protein